MENGIKALTLKRQWAEKILAGTKRYEVRNFQTAYRGPVVVTISGEKIAYCTVELLDIVPTDSVPELSDEERAYGKWAWVLGAVKEAHPVPCKGQLGLWAWDAENPAIEAEVVVNNNPVVSSALSELTHFDWPAALYVANWYVAILSDRERGFLLGPFPSATLAEEHIKTAKLLTSDSMDYRVPFATFCICNLPSDVTREGVLMDEARKQGLLGGSAQMAPVHNVQLSMFEGERLTPAAIAPESPSPVSADTYPIIRTLIAGTLAQRWEAARAIVLEDNPLMEGVNPIQQSWLAGIVAAAHMMNAYGDELLALEVETKATAAKHQTSATTILYDDFKVYYVGKGVLETLIDLSGDRDSFNTRDQVQRGKWNVERLPAALQGGI